MLILKIISKCFSPNWVGKHKHLNFPHHRLIIIHMSFKLIKSSRFYSWCDLHVSVRGKLLNVDINKFVVNLWEKWIVGFWSWVIHLLIIKRMMRLIGYWVLWWFGRSFSFHFKKFRSFVWLKHRKKFKFAFCQT